MKKIKLIAPLLALASLPCAIAPALSSCNSNPSPTPEVIKPTTLDIEGISKLRLGATKTFKYYTNILPYNADHSVEWTSSDTNVASIDKTNGVLTLHAVGKTTLTCKSLANTQLVKTMEVTVLAASPTSITITGEDTIVVDPGETHEYKATVAPKGSDQSIAWDVLPKTIASIDENTGKLTATASGIATVCAISKANDSIVGTKEVKINPHAPTPEEMTIEGNDSPIVGERPQYKCVISGSGVQEVTWSLPNVTSTFATIDSASGVLSSFMAHENVKVRATSIADRSVYVEKIINILGKAPTAIRIDGPSGIAPGSSIKLKSVVVTPSTGADSSVNWTMQAVVGIALTADGTLSVASSIPAGTEIIVTATSKRNEKIKATTIIKVGNPCKSIKITNDDNDCFLLPGQGLKLNATIDKGTGSDEVVWSSNNDLLSVDNQGNVVVNKAPTSTKAVATITCASKYSPVLVNAKKTITIAQTAPKKFDIVKFKDDTIHLNQAVGFNIENISPSFAANDVIWEIDKTKTVDADGVFDGSAFLPTKQGKLYVTATSKYDKSIKAESNEITVDAIPLHIEFIVCPELIYYEKGASSPAKFSYQAKVTPYEAPSAVEWSVDDTKIATVDEDGLVTPKTTGEITLTAQAKNYPKVSISKKIKIVSKPEYDFKTDTWANVNKHCKDGLSALKDAYGLDNFVGIEKELKVDELGTYIIRVVGQGEDHLSDNMGKPTTETAPLTFQFVTVLTEVDGSTFKPKPLETNWGHYDEKAPADEWEKSDIRAYLNDYSEFGFMSFLSSALGIKNQDFKVVSKNTITDSHFYDKEHKKNPKMNSAGEAIFLPSLHNIFSREGLAKYKGTDNPWYALEDEDQTNGSYCGQYSYYKTVVEDIAPSKIDREIAKKIQGRTMEGEIMTYWLRTPYVTTSPVTETASAWCMGLLGVVNYTQRSVIPVCPMFCL